MSPASQQQRAEVTAGIGAVILGIGIGALPALHLQRHALLFLFGGVLVHGWGMFDKHRLERKTGAPTPRWAEPLYWTCWLLLGVIILVALASR